MVSTLPGVPCVSPMVATPKRKLAGPSPPKIQGRRPGRSFATRTMVSGRGFVEKTGERSVA
jgi:hypothetical protein